ncbi:putative adhesion exoprotein [Lasius niger]|uniref:Putative adhesion exoprotein n=1 Tax=Lasius niger TaxID=67767 RepID=A0A0J7NMN9_LASNI|nr:putative adhesion exoprotein [Lasius niger]
MSASTKRPAWPNYKPEPPSTRILSDNDRRPGGPPAPTPPSRPSLPHTTNKSVAGGASNRGHTRFDCKRPAKKFCSQCGKDGVLEAGGFTVRSSGEIAGHNLQRPSAARGSTSARDIRR